MTTEAGEVKAGKGKTLELPIEAMDAGVTGNLDADAISVIVGSLARSLAATNPEPTAGGRELPSVQASDTDRERVKNLLMKSLEEAARKKVAGELSAGDLLFDQTMKVTQTLSEVYNPPAGAASTRLTLTMQVEFSVLYASAADLTRLASLALNASLPSGFSAASDAIRITPATDPTLDEDSSAKWTMRVERKIVQHIDTAQVTQMIQGFGAWNVESKLKENLPLASGPKIQLTPSWWPWMPILPFRIAVVTE
jgi:hypothetical protein